MGKGDKTRKMRQRASQAKKKARAAAKIPTTKTRRR